MKNKIFKGIALSIIAATVICCTPKKEEAPAEAVVAVDNDQIKTDIQAMETAYADAVNSGKSDDIVYYADDATSFSQNKPPLVGKEAIHKNMKDEIASSPKGAKAAFETKEVFPSTDGNQVVEIGSYKMSDSTNVVKYSGNYMAVFVKKDGKYTCIRDMATSDQPADKK